jgi:hypothetical protein
MAKMSRNRKIVVALAGGSIAAGVLAASAASLGTLSVQNLAASNNVIAACNGGGGIILTGWATPTYSFAASTGLFTENAAVISSISSGCFNRPFSLVIGNSSGASIATTVGTITGAATFGVVLPAFSVQNATQATLTIY